MFTKRKKTKEIRLEEYLGGFWDCLSIFEEMFREEFWTEYWRRRNKGLSTLGQVCKTDKSEMLWEGIEKANKKIRDKNLEHLELMKKRMKP